MTAPTAKRADTTPQPNPEAKRARVYEPGWKYVPKAESDIRKTFARIRRQQKLEAEAAAKAKPAKPVPVIHAERIKGAK